jgi:hypothetical protein
MNCSVRLFKQLLLPYILIKVIFRFLRLVMSEQVSSFSLYSSITLTSVEKSKEMLSTARCDCECEVSSWQAYEETGNFCCRRQQSQFDSLVTTNFLLKL